ncbi:MAG: hypothetical protein CM15mP64_1680 [Candidatus Neomarinimicrobiota bacterium]|nr:MAG: hypothetical protein CM15mP64_1680 [Candidatus Neomarinimicrobiota bacterium]
MDSNSKSPEMFSRENKVTYVAYKKGLNIVQIQKIGFP